MAGTPTVNTPSEGDTCRSDSLTALLARSEELRTVEYRYGLRLLDSARVFAESAIAYAQSNDAAEWMFMVVHTSTALELLLKAKLALRHQKYLVAGKMQVTPRQFAEGDFKSVDTDECIKRLKRHCGLALSDHQRLVIRALRNLRNRFAHYVELSDDTAFIKATAAAGLSLFLDLNDSEFSDIESNARSMPQLVEGLKDCKEFVRVRLATLEARLRSSMRPVTHYLDECSVCLQDAAVINGNTIRCLFCGRELSLSEMAEGFSDDGSVEACPICGRDSVLLCERNSDDPTRECFCCGYFTGPALNWSDWRTGEITRLHNDRTAI